MQNKSLDFRTTDRVMVWLANLAGMGTWPGPPGTYGTAVGVASFCCMQAWPQMLQLTLAIALNVAGVAICGGAAKALRLEDPSQVIWDEFASVILLFASLPPQLQRSPWVWLIGFALHRLFDISKLPPVHLCERLPGGWGIMADDIMAAAYAWGVLVGGSWLWEGYHVGRSIP